MKNCSMFLLLVLVVISGCSGENGSTDGGNGSEDLIGAFQVSLVPPKDGNPAYTSVLGTVFDGPTPAPIIWEQADKDGNCRLLTPRVPHCEEPCGGTALCVEDNVCQPYPAKVGVGTVDVEGLRTTSGATSFSMDPIAGNYQPVGVTLEYPGFSEGDSITFSAQGESQVPAFSLAAEGIGQLSVLDQTIELADGQPVTINWSQPGQADIADVYVKLDISHHGGSKGMIECNVGDTGSLELSAGMLDQLKALGISGYPSIVVSRRAIGSAEIPLGRVDLVIVSTIERFVEIPGLISCTSDSDCPTGQTCQDDLKCG